MTNLDNKEWEFSKGEKYAIRYWEGHGYEVTILKRYIAKDKCVISKNGFSFDYDLPLGDAKINYKMIMTQFEQQFDLAQRLNKLNTKKSAEG